LSPGVNFTNILCAAFAPKSFRQKLTNPNCKHLKAVQRILVWLSISPIFYKQLFHTKVLCGPFMCLQFGFVIFGKRILAQKLLIKCWWNWHLDISSMYNLPTNWRKNSESVWRKIKVWHFVKNVGAKSFCRIGILPITHFINVCITNDQEQRKCSKMSALCHFVKWLFCSSFSFWQSNYLSTCYRINESFKKLII
jgi:hypothetical protein